MSWMVVRDGLFLSEEEGTSAIVGKYRNLVKTLKELDRLCRRGYYQYWEAEFRSRLKLCGER